MQSVSSRIWTRVTVSISYDDNHYTTGTSMIVLLLTGKKIVICFCVFLWSWIRFLIQGFPSPRLVALPRVKSPVCPTNSWKVKEKNFCLSLGKAGSEAHTALYRNWTCTIKFIFYTDNLTSFTLFLINKTIFIFLDIVCRYFFIGISFILISLGFFYYFLPNSKKLKLWNQK